MLFKNQGIHLGEDKRLALFELEQLLFCGTLTADEYLRRVNDQVSSPFPISVDGLLKDLLMDEGALSVVDELRKSYQVVLLCDYPPEWLLEIDRQTDLSARFNRVIYTRTMNCTDERALFFQQLQARGELVAGECVWVDANPFRTAIAIRQSIDAIIYVEERRLRRELRLRSLIR